MSMRVQGKSAFFYPKETNSEKRVYRECIKLVRLGICINEEICGRRTRKNAKMVKSHV
jgi:hypothetical protein